jgi:hypothetical protein
MFGARHSGQQPAVTLVLRDLKLPDPQLHKLPPQKGQTTTLRQYERVSD